MEVTFVTHDGQKFTVAAEPNQTLRDLAVDLAIPGIVGACGGGCACASCHVYVDESWIERVGQPHEMEEMALDGAYDVRPNSRLACQIKMRPELDGLCIHTPVRQS